MLYASSSASVNTSTAHYVERKYKLGEFVCFNERFFKKYWGKHFRRFEDCKMEISEYHYTYTDMYKLVADGWSENKWRDWWIKENLMDKYEEPFSLSLELFLI